MSGIGNLGDYAEITSAAKAVGGVSKYLMGIEGAAVVKVAPRLVIRRAVWVLR